MLSVAQPFADGEALRIVRCRGIRPLAVGEQPGTDLYLPLDSAWKWGAT
jgi:hypothetical protein